jgi:hypothetical protein
MTLVCKTEGTLLVPVARESATKNGNPPHHSQVTVFNKTRRNRNVTLKVSEAFKVYLFKMYLTALSPRSYTVEYLDGGEVALDYYVMAQTCTKEGSKPVTNHAETRCQQGTEPCTPHICCKRIL